MNDFTPAIEYPVALPWPAPWDGVRCVFNLYACEQFLDDESEVLKMYRAPGRTLEAQGRDLTAQQAALAPDDFDGAARVQETYEAWVQAARAHRRARLVAELGYYVLRVEWPDGAEHAGDAPATWDRFPLRLLEWLTGPGYTQARNTLWASPKAQPPTLEPPPAG